MKYSHPPGGAHLVNEGDCCPKWEPCKRASIAVMPECWFCRWSGFDSNKTDHQTESICGYNEEQKIGEKRA